MNYLPDGESSERLNFRRLTQDDFEDLLPYFYDDESTNYVNVITGTAEERCKYLINTVLKRYENGNGLMALTSKENGKLIGMCGLLVQEIDGNEVIEIGYHILPSERRKGYASEASQKCKEYAFENKLTPALVSIINEKNTNSMKVATNNGMKLHHRTNWRGYPVHVYRIANDGN